MEYSERTHAPFYPEVIEWREAEEGLCLITTAIPSVPPVDLPGGDFLKAWPSMVRQLRIIHELVADQCLLDRSL
jgi:streptomycin 3"-kinase